MSDSILSVKQIQQIDGITCGAACTEIVLDFLMVRSLDQGTLFREIRNAGTVDTTVDWESSPDGIRKILNDDKPIGSNVSFKLVSKTTVSAIERSLNRNILVYQVPAIILIHGMQHWIIVNGVKFDDSRPAGRNGHPPVAGYYIVDPLEVGTDSYQCIFFSQLVNNYLTDPVFSGKWQNHFLAVCDPKDKKFNKLTVFGSAAPETNIVSKNTHPDTLLLGKFIQSKAPEEKKAAAYAKWGLWKFGFTEQKLFKDTLKQIMPGPPVRVKYLSRKNSYYYLVPIYDQPSKNIHAMVVIEGKKLDFRETLLTSNKKNPLIFSRLNNDQIKALVSVELKKNKHKTIIGKIIISIEKEMVWKPCFQSFSVYKPFYLARIGKKVFYVRIDGKVFTKLTKSIGT